MTGPAGDESELKIRNPKAAAMASAFRTLMNAVYAVCASVAGVALVAIAGVIPWAVYTRYVLNRAASWPEPTAVLLMIVLWSSPAVRDS